jgi:hypothetical protein
MTSLLLVVDTSRARARALHSALPTESMASRCRFPANAHSIRYLLATRNVRAQPLQAQPLLQPPPPAAAQGQPPLLQRGWRRR